MSVLSPRAREKASKFEQQALSKSFTFVWYLFNAMTNSAGWKDHTFISRTFFRTKGIYHNHDAFLDKVPVCEWLHLASKEAGHLKAGMRHFVSSVVCLRRKEVLLCRFAWQFDNNLFPLGSRHQCKARCLVFQWRSVKKYFSHSRLKTLHSRFTFLVLKIADMMIFRGASVVKILVKQICAGLTAVITTRGADLLI